MYGKRDLQERLLPTPFFSSFVAAARPGDLCQADPKDRASAWAYWAIDSVSEMMGLGDREYIALLLHGKFRASKGKEITIHPHIEISQHWLESAAPNFPDRLAQMGNGLTYAWWSFPEVTAAKRALLPTNTLPIDEMVATFDEHRLALVQNVIHLTAAIAPHWEKIADAIVQSPDGLTAEMTEQFSELELRSHFSQAAHLHLSVEFDTKLREKAGSWTTRSLGVWGIHQKSAGVLGAITPRLAAASLFKDPTFKPETESSAALLVRGLVLARLLRYYVDRTLPTAVAATPTPPPVAFLRAIPARKGAKLPEATLQAATRFLESFPDADDAWAALAAWSAKTQSLLTVAESGYKASHKNAMRYLRNNTEPQRDDINVILPLAWDSESRVVRVTFARGHDA